MELRQLAHFVAVAEESHFTRAADRVHVVQSSLSASVAALERELGSPLFTRTSRHVELTQAGVALLPAARRALAAAEDGRASVDAVRGVMRGHLTIGVIQSFGAVDLPGLITAYHRRHPAITLTLRHDSVPNLVRGCRDSELDLAFVDRPFDTRGLHQWSWGSEALVLAVAATDELAHRRRIRLSALAGREFVEYRADSALRARIDDVCRRVGLERTICCEVDTIADMVRLVGAGLGVALLPQDTVRDNDHVITLATDPGIKRELCVIVTGGHAPAPSAQALLDLLADSS